MQELHFQGRSGSQKSLKPLTFEQRSASPRELAQWILGRNRQRAVVSVQLEGTDKVMERLTYLWKSKQVCSLYYTQTFKGDKIYFLGCKNKILYSKQT